MEEQDVKKTEEQDIQPQQEGVENEEDTQPQQETQETLEQTQEQAPAVGSEQQYDPNLYDDRGVSWKNVAMENKRKFEQSQEKQDEKFQQILEQVQQGSQKQKYTKSQLRAFSQDQNTPANERMWAEQEIDKMEKAELGNIVEQKLTSYQKQQQDTQMRQQALQTVQQRQPNAFVKNAQGQIVGWNNKSPLTRKIGQYLQDPDIKNNPRGLLVATAMANWDLSQSGQAQTQKLKQEVREAQKKTMVEGGGKRTTVSKSSLSKAIDRARETGSLKDATVAMGEHLRAKGTIQSED